MELVGMTAAGPAIAGPTGGVGAALGTAVTFPCA